MIAKEGTAPVATSLPPLPPDALIVVPVRNTVLFPGMVLPITLGRPKSIAAAQQAVRLGPTSRMVNCPPELWMEITPPSPSARFPRRRPAWQFIATAFCRKLVSTFRLRATLFNS